MVEKEGDTVSATTTLTMIRYGAKILRWLRLNGIIKEVKSQANLGLVCQLHEQVIHHSRDLGMRMEKWVHTEAETTALAKNVCTSSMQLMSNFLELKPGYLNCCFKVLHPSIDKGTNFKVASWTRSSPYDSRQKDKTEYTVKDNSVWSAMFGEYDGKTNWDEPYDCFTCNDLWKYSNFQNSRKDWKTFYRSCLVFPIKYISYEEGQPVDNLIGFLAFDSPKAGAFGNVPDIFKYSSDLESRAKYYSLLHSSPTFHIGAIIADTLSMFLRSAYSNNIKT